MNVQLGKKIKRDLPEKKAVCSRQQRAGDVRRFWTADCSPRHDCRSQNHFVLSNHRLCCHFLIKQPIFSPKLNGKLVEKMKCLLFITVSSGSYSYLIHSRDFSWSIHAEHVILHLNGETMASLTVKERRKDFLTELLSTAIQIRQRPFVWFVHTSLQSFLIWRLVCGHSKWATAGLGSRNKPVQGRIP